MKKMFLGAAALLFIGGAYAQSGANTTNLSQGVQSGVNSGTVTQVSFGTLVNFSDLNQLGANNADVLQVGANDSFINQTGSNQADVNQDGGDGFYTGTASYQVSTIDQVGTNDADVDQTGDGNNSNIDQTNGPGGLLNVASVQQGQNNNDSSDNMAQVTQNDNSNYAFINQDGDDNMSVSDQDSANASSGIYGAISQFVQVNQTGFLNGSDVTQTGDDNVAFVFQDAVDGSAGDPKSNEATIVQDGTLNWSQSFQSDGLINAANNSINVTQTNNVAGPGNFSNHTQQGANTLTVTQTNF